MCFRHLSLDSALPLLGFLVLGKLSLKPFICLHKSSKEKKEDEVKSFAPCRGTLDMTSEVSSTNLNLLFPEAALLCLVHAHSKIRLIHTVGVFEEHP